MCAVEGLSCFYRCYVHQKGERLAPRTHSHTLTPGSCLQQQRQQRRQPPQQPQQQPGEQRQRQRGRAHRRAHALPAQRLPR